MTSAGTAASVMMRNSPPVMRPGLVTNHWTAESPATHRTARLVAAAGRLNQLPAGHSGCNAISSRVSALMEASGLPCWPNTQTVAR